MRGYFQKIVGRIVAVGKGQPPVVVGKGQPLRAAPPLLMLGISILLSSPISSAQEHQHHMHHNMQLDETGMVMNENTDQLPRGCPRIAAEQAITVRAGKEFASHGSMFAYDQKEWHFEPCTKLTVTLQNTDNVRHQWMLHGLPRYVYPQGMFTLEVAGKGQRTGTFILPPGNKTYLVHCDVPQHMEKGMKAQLKGGAGNGDLPSIPGVTGPRLRDPYAIAWNWWTHGAVVVLGSVGMFFIGRRFRLFP